MRAISLSYSLVVRRIKDLNHLFVSVDTLSVRVYLSFRALYVILPLSCRRRVTTLQVDFILPYVVPLHNNSMPSAEPRDPVDYRHSIDRRLHRQPSPRDRSPGRIPFGLAAIHPSSLMDAGLVSARDVRLCDAKYRRRRERRGNLERIHTHTHHRYASLEWLIRRNRNCPLRDSNDRGGRSSRSYTHTQREVPRNSKRTLR